ncbi:MAG TPA: tRNA lysidine(34) synthetase TilS [Balneolaceae bacterium]|nr:tRNA lysidine(34) synthetase TilS [Balneolaceae bacterium]
MSKSDWSLIEKAVHNGLKYFSDHSRPFFIIGVSGGIDSMSLLYSFYKLEIPALVSHINYQKRDEASDKDVELVEQMASEWGFECRVTTADSFEDEGQNFQQWARDVRYDVFRSLASENNATGIAVAHNEDDQIETILQKMFRGAGLESWSGMEIWNGELFRPFLEISRAEIEQYAQHESIPYRTDESNLESDFARNFLRNEWLEKMDDFFPGWKENVERLSQQSQNYGQALEWINRRISDPWGIERQAFHSLDENLQKALILHLIRQKDPGLQISHKNLAQLEQVADLQTGKEIQLTDAFSLVRDRDRYVIRRNLEKKDALITLKYEQLQTSPIEKEGLIFSVEAYDDPDFSKALYLDVEKIHWPLNLRNWQKGDAFQPLGMEGHQSVSDHLTNRKVSAAYKNQAMVIESFEETICAVIFPPIKNEVQPGTISEQFKCDTGTNVCLKIMYSNHGSTKNTKKNP